MKKYIQTLSKIALGTLLASALVLTSASAQTANSFCPYTFTKNLSTGARDADVVVLQKILNSDSRTAIAASGIASPGQETNYFGPATRDAVKKFQALFIEYIGVANGVFGPKTRTVMNAVCNSEAFVQGNSSTYSSVTTAATPQNTSTTTSTSTTPTEKIPPSLFIRSNSTSVTAGNSFRIIVSASEPILKFEPDSMIIEGGSVGEIRKLGPNSYSVLITPTEGAKLVLLQIEADRVQDLAGNVNENASNEIRVIVVQPVATATTSTSTAVVIATPTSPFDFSSIMDRILASVATSSGTTNTNTNQSCSNGATNYPSCNSFVNNSGTSNSGSGSNSGNSGQNGQNSLMNMAMLSRLLGGNNGGLFGNNKQQATGNPCQLGPSAACTAYQQQQGTGGQGGQTGPCPASDQSEACKIKRGEVPGTASTTASTGQTSKDLGGTTNKSEYVCIATKNPKTGTIRDTSNNGSGGKYVVVDVKLTSQGLIGTSKLLWLGKDKDAQAIPANKCFVGGTLKNLQEPLLCCKAVRTVNGKKICDEHPEIQGKQVTEFFDLSVTKPRFEGTCNSGDIKAPSSNQADQNAQNDPNSLTPANPSGNQNQQPQGITTLSPQQCLDAANAQASSQSADRSQITSIINSISSAYPECSGKLSPNCGLFSCNVKLN